MSAASEQLPAAVAHFAGQYTTLAAGRSVEARPAGLGENKPIDLPTARLAGNDSPSVETAFLNTQSDAYSGPCAQVGRGIYNGEQRGPPILSCCSW